MRYNIVSLLSVCVLFSCNMTGVEVDTDDSFRNTSLDSLNNTPLETDPPTVQVAEDTVYLENGIYIAYIKKGEGEKVKEDDVIMIDYACKLIDGKIFDTNKKIGKPIPFMVGWGLQTTGWDVVLPYLNEGDEVSVYLPATFARGEKGIPELVPPNSPNIIDLTIHQIRKPDLVEDGVEIWIINRGANQPEVRKGDEVLIDYFAHAKSTPRYDNSFKNGEPFQLKVGGGNNLPGLNISLSKAKLSDKLWVRIPSKHAFGSKGNQHLVKPNLLLKWLMTLGER